MFYCVARFFNIRRIKKKRPALRFALNCIGFNLFTSAFLFKKFWNLQEVLQHQFSFSNFPSGWGGCSSLLSRHSLGPFKIAASWTILYHTHPHFLNCSVICKPFDFEPFCETKYLIFHWVQFSIFFGTMAATFELYKSDFHDNINSVSDESKSMYFVVYAFYPG